MKLYELKTVIDRCYKNTDDGDGDVDVEIEATDDEGVFYGFDIKSIGQFGVVKDVIIRLHLLNRGG